VASPDDQQAEANAQWLGMQKGEPVRFEKVEPGDEQILPPPEQRELDDPSPEVEAVDSRPVAALAAVEPIALAVTRAKHIGSPFARKVVP
jgi:hypothetical protein